MYCSYHLIRTFSAKFDPTDISSWEPLSTATFKEADIPSYMFFAITANHWRAAVRKCLDLDPVRFAKFRKATCFLAPLTRDQALLVMIINVLFHIDRVVMS